MSDKMNQKGFGNFKIQIHDKKLSFTIFNTRKKKAIQKALGAAPGSTFDIHEFAGSGEFRIPFAEAVRLHPKTKIPGINA